MGEVIIRMWDAQVSRLKKPHTKTGNPKVHYTVDRSLVKHIDYPKTIVLLDAPSEDQYLEFGNREGTTYYSRSYESVLEVVN